MAQRSLQTLEQNIPNCTRCPELRAYCAEVGETKRKAFQDWIYWAKPVPGFGHRRARILIVGLAPAAHGANRTGRMFTGDRSGDFLYDALHRAGLANQVKAVSRDDGLSLSGVYITAALRCAPPKNKPTTDQLNNCRPYLIEEFQLLRPTVTICLGGIAWRETLKALGTLDVDIPSPRPKFTHGAQVDLSFTTLIGCYHVSQQNTFTGRLTEKMIEEIFEHANATLQRRMHENHGERNLPWKC